MTFLLPSKSRKSLTLLSWASSSADKLILLAASSALFDFCQAESLNKRIGLFRQLKPEISKSWMNESAIQIQIFSESGIQKIQSNANGVCDNDCNKHLRYLHEFDL